MHRGGTEWAVDTQGPAHQPTIPLAPEEIVSEAIECARAGASIIHFHAYDPSTMIQRHPITQTHPKETNP